MESHRYYLVHSTLATDKLKTLYFAAPEPVAHVSSDSNILFRLRGELAKFTILCDMVFVLQYIHKKISPQ